MLGKNTVLIVLHLRFQLHARILKNEVTIVRCLPCAVDGGWTFFAFRQLFMNFLPTRPSAETTETIIDFPFFFTDTDTFSQSVGCNGSSCCCPYRAL